MAKRRLKKSLLSLATVLAVFVFAGCFRPFEITDRKPPVIEKERIYRNLEVGMTYEEVLAMMGPPGDFTTRETCYIVNSYHSLGPLARYWYDDQQNIVLFFDLDDKLTGKELFRGW